MTQPAEHLAKLGGGLFVVIGGREYDVPEHPARAWIEAVVRAEYDAVLPALLGPEDRDDVYDRLLATTWSMELEDEDDAEPTLSPLDLRQPALELETAAAGRPWWEAHRLVVMVLDGWETFDGWCGEHQIAPLEMPYDRFLNLVQRWAVTHIPHKEVEDFLRRLREAPITNPADLADNPEWDAEEESGFLAAMAMAGGASGR